MRKVSFNVVVVLLQYGLWLTQEVQATSPESCLTSCACSVIQQINSYNAKLLGLNTSSNVQCDWHCSNQCLDCTTAQQILDGLTGGARSKRQAYNFAAFPSSKWPTFPIPYLFDSSIGPQNPNATNGRNAIAHIQAQTCIRFTEVQQPPTSQSYITISLGTSCVTFVGRTTATLSSPITASASCLNQFGQMLYLLVQTLGLWHESQRYDRDQYVTIVSSNIAPGAEGYLGIINQTTQLLLTYGLPYDYASIMQFPPQVFSKNGNFTIRTNDPLYQNTLGQRVQLSFLDTELLNLLYCSGTCSGQPLSGTCNNGGYQNPNNCSACHCPDGYGGQFCTDLEPSTAGANCGGDVTAGYTELLITSPGYSSPGYYPQQVKCSWRITGPVGSKIGLRFFGDFGVYCSGGVSCYHWVEVKDVGQIYGPRFCCSTLPPSLNSTTNQVLVVFQSNFTIADNTLSRGFQLGYKIVYPDQPTTTTTTTPTTTTTTTTTVSSTTTTTVTSTKPTTTTTKIPASSAAGASGPCSPNPCHNMGQCVVDSTSATGFKCSCPTGLSGNLCQQGNCGGCSLTPGYLQNMCTAVVQPVKMCNVTVYGGSSSSSSSHWYRRGKRSMTRTQIVQQACTTTICCDNAQAIANMYCAVAGWTDWSPCSGSCGGGYMVKYYYSFDVQSQYRITNSTTQTCNLQTCQCSRWSFWSLFFSCRACNNGFSQQGNTCRPKS